MLIEMVSADADTDSQAYVPPASGGRAYGEAWRAAGGGKEAAAVHLQEGRHRLQHPGQVPRPPKRRGIRGLHQGEDQTHPGEQAAHRDPEERRGDSEKPKRVQFSNRGDDYLTDLETII